MQQQVLRKVFGNRILPFFAGISFLTTAILAALFIVSRYAVASYAMDQINRLPWDVIVGQQGALDHGSDVRRSLAARPGVKTVEEIGFLRARNGDQLEVKLNGSPVAVGWIALISASRPELLPPEIRTEPSTIAGSNIAIRAALVSPIGTDSLPIHVDAGSLLEISAANLEPANESFGTARLRPASFLSLQPQPTFFRGVYQFAEGGQRPKIWLAHTGEVTPPPQLDTIYRARLVEPAAQMDRQEFNKWMLDHVGALSYMPESTLVMQVPSEDFRPLAELLHQAFGAGEMIHGAESSPPYTPELIHLISVDRDALVSPWFLSESANRVSAVADAALTTAAVVDQRSYSRSDLQAVLSRMADIAASVGIVSLLMALPLLFLCWAVAGAASELLMMNERRLIGLLLVRGISMRTIARELRLQFLKAGLFGGLCGAVVGIVLPILGYAAGSGHAPPPSVIVEGAGYLIAFTIIGTGTALIAGSAVIGRIRDMSAAAAIARVLPNSAEARPPVWRPLLGILAVGLGGAQIIGWLLSEQGLASDVRDGASAPIMLLLNLLILPLFLGGCAILLASFPRLFGAVFQLPARWIAGRMRMATTAALVAERRRGALLLFVTSLATALALMPRIAADTFSDRIDRGVAIGLGGDMQVEYDLAALTGYKVPQPYSFYRRTTSKDLGRIRSALEKQSDVTRVAMIQQYLLPDVFLPNQGGLPLDIIDNVDHYLDVVRYDQRLGGDRPFTDVLGGVSDSAILATRGFMLTRDLKIGETLVAGYKADGREVRQPIEGALSFLPGQPSRQVQQREGFSAAEIDYLNYSSQSDARAVVSETSLVRSDLASVPVIPQSVTFVLRLADNYNPSEITRHVKALPVPPRSMRWLASERAKASSDMFVTLALQVMRVFMIGGLAIAMLGIVAIGIANFISYRRMLTLVSIRGASSAMMTRMAAGLFLLPVFGGVLLGILLGLAGGFGIAHVIWTLPRIRGVPAFLANEIQITGGSLSIFLVVGGFLIVAAAVFGTVGVRILGTRKLRTD